MAIVWPCTMTAHDYAAAGKDVSVPRPNCPACGAAMIFFGTYSRPLRIAVELRLVIGRARCSPCKVSHALLPDFVAVARLDGIEVIGSLLEQSAAGHSTIGVAQRLGVPYTTARGWRRRIEQRAGLLVRGFLAVTVALGDLVPKLGVGELAALLSAIGSAVKAARRRLGALGADWRVANRVVGGQLLGTNINPPWICS